MTKKNTARDLARHLPSALLKLDRWMTWSTVQSRGGKPTKKPDGSVATPSDWHTFEAIADTDCDGYSGVGFVFTGGIDKDGYRLVSFDVDACRDPSNGALSPWAQNIVNHYRTFTEVTPSGTGLRVWLWVKNPPNYMPVIYVSEPPPSGVEDKKPQIQTFGLGSAQYVTVTGSRLNKLRVIKKHEDLQWIIDEYNVADTEHDPSHEDSDPRGDGPDKVRRILQDIEDVDDRDVWLKVGMGLHHEFAGGEVGLELWNEWAAKSAKFDEDDSRRVWESFGKGGTTIRTLDFLARQGKSVFDDGFFDGDEWQPPEKPTPKGRVLQAADFAAACGPTKCLVYNLLPASGLCQIFGEPACGKTPFALSLSLHVALNRDWFGHEMERHGAVVYMVGEDMTGVRDRVTGQLEQLVPGTQLSDIPWFGTNEPGRLIEEADAKRWLKDIRATVGDQPISLLVIDTQNRNFGPGNENSTEDMTQFIDNIDLLRRHLGCCVLLVHHVGLEDKTRGRGSSALFGALDVVFEVQKTNMSVRMVPHKHKNWARPKDLLGTLVPVVIGTDEKGRDQTAITLSDKVNKSTPFVDMNDPQLHAILKAIRLSDGKPITQKEICTATGLTRKQLRILIGKLIDAGMLNVQGGTGGAATSYSITEFGVASFFPGDDSEQAEIDEMLS